MRPILTIILATLSALTWAVPDDYEASDPSDAQVSEALLTAEAAYFKGEALIKEAEALSLVAQSETDTSKLETLADDIQYTFEQARQSFQEATGFQPDMASAWAYAGYTQRQLGSYYAALASYNEALRLRPDFLEAVEYRAEAYLALNQLDNAKQAYLDLFTGNRQIAAELMLAMQAWIKTQEATEQGSAEVEAFQLWVEERLRIEQNTAALTRAGADPDWH